ncbi:MAG: YkgJ family cysteine cluster protein [Bacteroidales bacterium]|nr:YkgJ family cysteine cluster protein [Bacteroidales bacterium]
MECRPNCGACCIAISISSPIPGMPDGKPAGVRCIHLADDYTCKIFGKPERPKVCIAFEAEELICGKNRDEALKIINDLENS